MSLLLVVASPRVAGASISWSAVNPPLPSNAVPGQGLTIVSSSCPADGWCVAVGDYAAVSGSTYYDAGLILSESGGTWSAAAAPLPPGAASADPQAFLESVSCPSVGSCVAVGRYLDNSGATQGLTEQLASGVWSPAAAALPAGATATGTGAYAELSAVSCPSATSCTALGVDTQGGTEQAVADTFDGTTWTAVAAPVPAPASGSQFIALSCPAAGACVATGTYLVGGTYDGMVDTLSGGSWTTTALPLPAGASPLASVANGDLWVSCAAVGSCAVAATTFDGNYEGVLDTLSGGVWTSQDAPVPGGQSSPDVQLDSVSCSDASTCVATGLATVNGVAEGLFESLSAGAWGASAAPVPAGTQAGAAIEVHNVACPSDGTCVAEGQSDLTGTVTGLFWNLSSGSWVVTPTPLPADAAASSDPALAPVTCPAAGACVAIGTYFGPNGREGVIDTDPSLAASTTTVSLQRLSSTTTSYSATVSGAGGPTGSVVFSAGLDALCSAPLVNGTATCSGPVATASTVLGSYSGDAVFSPSWGTAVNPGAPAMAYVVGGWLQSTRVNTFFPAQMVVRVVDAAGVGVPGVVVTFTLPTRGPSAMFWGWPTVTTNASGYAASPYMSANGAVGAFNPTATAGGLAGADVFYFQNTKR